MTTTRLLAYCLTMALVTYFIRMLPLVLINKKIKNKFLNSFLYYIPFAVLSAMVIPDIFFATGSYTSAIVGFVVAVVVAFFGKSLTFVALSSCLAVLIVELIIKYF